MAVRKGQQAPTKTHVECVGLCLATLINDSNIE